MFSQKTDKIKNMKRILASITVSMSPIIALAQYSPSMGISGLFLLVGSWVKLALPLLISLSVVWFVYNVFNYAILASDEDAKKKAKESMIWGIGGIFVMVSVWGLVGILQATFGTAGTTINIGSQLPI